MTFPMLNEQAYFEQFVGDTRYFNVHRDARIENLLKQAGVKFDNDPDRKRNCSYMIERGVIHVASKIYSSDEMIKKLKRMSGVYDVNPYKSSWDNDTYFVTFHLAGIGDWARGEYDDTDN